MSCVSSYYAHSFQIDTGWTDVTTAAIVIITIGLLGIYVGIIGYVWKKDICTHCRKNPNKDHQPVLLLTQNIEGTLLPYYL